MMLALCDKNRRLVGGVYPTETILDGDEVILTGGRRCTIATWLFGIDGLQLAEMEGAAAQDWANRYGRGDDIPAMVVDDSGKMKAAADAPKDQMPPDSTSITVWKKWCKTVGITVPDFSIKTEALFEIKLAARNKGLTTF